ncbi:hypothetical protein L1887_53348 [Cichorium endivia]|nr:hypothetical protein L1887_53348 [Cichorium endivia]
MSMRFSVDGELACMRAVVGLGRARCCPWAAVSPPRPNYLPRAPRKRSVRLHRHLPPFASLFSASQSSARLCLWQGRVTLAWPMPDGCDPAKMRLTEVGRRESSA